MKVLVLYKSKTGFTLRYAEAIAKEARAKLMEVKEATLEVLNSYDVIIYGGGLYAGVINGYSRIKKMYDKSTCKKLVLFAVGAMPKDNLAFIERMWRQNIHEGELKAIPHFYLQGGIDYDKLGFFSRILLKKVAKINYKKNPKSDLRESFDNVTIGNLEPILNYLMGKK